MAADLRAARPEAPAGELVTARSLAGAAALAFGSDCSVFERKPARTSNWRFFFFFFFFFPLGYLVVYWFRLVLPMLAQRISSLPGVAQVNVYGSQKFAVRIQLDPDALAARGIGIDQVAGRRPGRQRQSADRQPRGPEHGRTRSRRTASSPTPRPSASRSSPIATARRCASAISARVVDSVENDKVGELVQRRSRHRARHSAPAGHRTPSRWWMRIQPGPAELRGAAAAASVDLHIIYDRVAIDPRRGRRRAVHAAADARRWWCS